MSRIGTLATRKAPLALLGLVLACSVVPHESGPSEGPDAAQAVVVAESGTSLLWPIREGVSSFVTQSPAQSSAEYPCGSGVNGRHILHEGAGENRDYMHSIDIVVRDPEGNEDRDEGRGTAIVAVAEGRVVAANFSQNECDRPFGAGNYVVIEHPDILVDGKPLLSAYMHLNSLAGVEDKAECGINPRPARAFTPPTVGSWVHAGELLGQLGNTGNSTGPHLHFQFATECILEPAHAVDCPSISVLDVNPVGFAHIRRSRDRSCGASPAIGGPEHLPSADTYLPDGTYVLSKGADKPLANAAVGPRDQSVKARALAK